MISFIVQINPEISTSKEKRLAKAYDLLVFGTWKDFQANRLRIDLNDSLLTELTMIVDNFSQSSTDQLFHCYYHTFSNILVTCSWPPSLLAFHNAFFHLSKGPNCFHCCQMRFPYKGRYWWLASVIIVFTRQEVIIRSLSSAATVSSNQTAMRPDGIGALTSAEEKMWQRDEDKELTLWNEIFFCADKLTPVNGDSETYKLLL